MKRKYLIIICIFMFFIFLGMYLTNTVDGIDNIMYDVIISVKSDITTTIMKFITFFGSTKFILFLMILFFIFSFKYKLFYIINVIIMGDVVLNNLVKIIIRRDRPTLINMVNENTFSFPSGHTMISITLYGFILYLINKSKISKNKKILLNVCLLLLVILILISRIYLGAHYFSDVMAGMFLALGYLLICIDIYERKSIK